MKTDSSGRPDVTARISPSAPEPADRRNGLLRAILALGAAGFVVALVAIFARHAILGVLLTRGVGFATGYRVSIGAFALGPKRSSFTELRVTAPNGDPLLDARRVTLDYSLGALVSGKGSRFGLSAVTLDGPRLTIVRHADGHYNLGSRASTKSGAPAAAGNGSAPWQVDVRIRSGAVRLVDLAPVAADLREQRIDDVNLRAQFRSAGRSMASGGARLIGRQTQSAPVRAWPIELGALLDYPRGAAIVRIDAAMLPVRGALGFLQHSVAVRVDDGLLSDTHVKLYALDIAPDHPLQFQVGGAAELRAGRLRIAALRQPVRDLHGHITLVNDGVWSTRLDARLGALPLIARGGVFDRFQPTLRLALRADGDLRDLRRLFSFSRTAPLTGGVHVETLLEAPVSALLIRSALSIQHGTYGRVPLSAVAGRVDYHAGTIVLDGVRGRYGPSLIGVGARFLLGGPVLDSAIVAYATAPGRQLPFAENLAPEAAVDAVALITGGPAGYRARGALGLQAPGTTGNGVFAVDERGVGEFGPFAIERRDGSSVVGALRLERPSSRSAAWISARGFRVAVPAVGARFAGLNVPAFPPVAGVLDGELAGGGSPGDFEVAGALRGHDLRVGVARLGVGRAVLAGKLGELGLDAVAVDGPLGRFSGTGAVSAGSFALRGRYDGSLERLVPLTGNQQAHGAIGGDVLATIANSNVVVQSTGAALAGGSVRGVALDAAAGTVAVRANRFHLLVGSASIEGRRAVATESSGTIAVSAPDLPVAALRATGVPLQAGNVSIFGVADLRNRLPDFAGTILVANGRARGYRVAGDARIGLVGADARVFGATGALGSTYGSIEGTIAGLGGPELRLDLHSRVPLGDLDLLRRDLGLPVANFGGSFAAALRVHGSGGQPIAEGLVEAPEGSYNGLAFRSASAQVALDSFGVAAREGRLTVGSTTTAIEASLRGQRLSVAARSGNANLADFNDYFDAGDTLAGRGAFDVGFDSRAGHVTSHGALAMRGVRYRDFNLGQTNAHWATHGGSIAGGARVASAAGTLETTASITPHSGNLLEAFRTARYDAVATVSRLDLGTWLPASGLALPVQGRVDARIGVAGRLPQLALTLQATLTNATIHGIAVEDAHLRASSQGSRINVQAGDADLGFAKLTGRGRLGLGPGEPLDFDLRATTADAGRAARLFIPVARGLDLAGALDADVRLSGTRARPTLAGGFELRDARLGSFIVPRTIGELGFADGALELRDADVEFTHGQAFVAGSLPLLVQPFGLGPARAPLSFDVTARGVELAQFAPLLPAGTALGGTVDGRFGVEGTVDRPRLLGSLDVANGSYASPFERAPIQHVGASLAFAGSSVALQAFHADVGGGTLDGSGLITLPLGNRSRVGYEAKLSAKAAKLDFPVYGHGTLDGDLQLQGVTGRPVVSGNVALRDAVVPVSAVYGASSGAGNAGSVALALNPAFTVHVVAGNNVRVRSSIVDIGVAGSVDLAGTLRAPQLAGEFTATDGTISSYNHVFRIVNAAVTFDPADGAIPTVQARAISRVTNPDPDPSRNIAGSANIIVTVSGTADSNNLQVTYSSDPPYSQEQIIGLLLDVPALLGAVNFNLNGGVGGPVLRGAPGETNALLPPGVTPEQVTATSFNQEVFSILNGQFTQRALTPIERVFEKTLGLSDIEFTVDYGGGIGYSLRRQIGKRDFYAFLSQTVTYPERSNLGFELEPRPFETVNFSYYQQNGITSLITNQTPGEESLSSTRRLTSVQPLGNRSGFSVNFNRRF